jgi:hypothetical protein
MTLATGFCYFSFGALFAVLMLVPAAATRP